MLFWNSTFIQSLNMNVEKAPWIKCRSARWQAEPRRFWGWQPIPSHISGRCQHKNVRTLTSTGRQLGEKEKKNPIGSVTIQRKKTHLKGAGETTKNENTVPCGSYPAAFQSHMQTLNDLKYTVWTSGWGQQQHGEGEKKGNTWSLSKERSHKLRFHLKSQEA